VHKSQGLTLAKIIVDIGNKEFAAGLSFIAISRVCKLSDIIFRPLLMKDFSTLKNEEDIRKEG